MTLQAAPTCPDCGDRMVVRDTPKGPFWMCERTRVKGCAGKIGAHADTLLPMGTPADRETRALRHECHVLFDALWTPSGGRPPIMSRQHAYAWLGGVLRLSKEKCHFGLFDAAQCRKAMEEIKRFRAEHERTKAQRTSIPRATKKYMTGRKQRKFRLNEKRMRERGRRPRFGDEE